MTRRAFLRTTAASALLLRHSGWTAERSNDRPTDGDLLAQCQAGIEKHRKGDGVILLRDASGQPLSRATLQIEQTRHDFLFGCNFFMFGRHSDPALEEAYRQRFSALLNYGTLGFYWAYYEGERGRPNYDYTDRVVDYCAKHGILCKGHPLVWDHPAGSPPWLPEGFKEIERLSLARVREIVTRFKGRIDYWDVVNEATHLPDDHNETRMAHWGKAVGPVDYVRAHLRVAREANQTGMLLVNDYRTDEPYYRLLESQRERGSLSFDAVGIQSHMHGGRWPLHKVWHTCDRFAKLGVPIHFTETTLVSGPRQGRNNGWGPTTPDGEARQAEQTVNFYTALFAHPAIQAITWWDLSDHGAWQRAPAGWLRRDMSPKPVYDRIRQLIRGDWWTKIESRPDAEGRVPLRAFHGKHRVTVTLPGGLRVEREIHLQRGQPNRFTLTIA